MCLSRHLIDHVFWTQESDEKMTTAQESVDKIVHSEAFQKARRVYWMSAPEAPLDRRTQDLKGLRVFTDVEIADESAAGHRRIAAELQAIFDKVEEWRLARSKHYSKPERQAVLGMLTREKVLLDLAEVLEG